MAFTVRTTHRENRKSKSKASRKRRSLQKPNGVISPRVQKVGGDKFGIVCIDPAKHRSEWMMADYFGNVLIEPQTVKHQAAFFQLAVEQVHHAHQTPIDRLLAELEAAIEQLPYNTRNHEATIVAQVLQQQANRRRGTVAVGELLAAVLARLGIRTTNINESGDRP